MNKWNKTNALWVLLYAVLYVIMTYAVCLTGMIHPACFVCYQITAGILLSGLVIRAFNRIKAPGVAACLSLVLILLLFAIQDAVAWHVIPLIIIAVLAECIRAALKYNWTGDVIATIIMTFSSFSYYGLSADLMMVINNIEEPGRLADLVDANLRPLVFFLFLLTVIIHPPFYFAEDTSISFSLIIVLTLAISLFGRQIGRASCRERV